MHKLKIIHFILDFCIQGPGMSATWISCNIRCCSIWSRDG